MHTAEPSRRLLALATGAYLLFVAYQSLAGRGFEACVLPLSQQGARLSFSDGVANFVAYLPLGMLVVAWSGARGRPALLFGVFVAIAGFSLTMETLQACLSSRVSSWYDWATNSAGGLLGMMVPSLAGGRARGGPVRHPAHHGRLRDEALFWPVLLYVGTWLALSLAPWRFTLDVGTLRANLSFLRDVGEWAASAGSARNAWRFLHHLGGWLAVGLAVRALPIGRRRATLALALTIGASLAGQAMLVRPSLSFTELLAMATAFACCALLPAGVRAALLVRALPVCALLSVAAYQLAPQRGGWLATDFHWWPQLGRGGLLSGLALALLFSGFSFALVLSLRWMAASGVALGRRPLLLSLLGALAMLLLEYAQRWIPGRIGDTSAPVLMLMAFFVAWSLTGSTQPRAAAVTTDRQAGRPRAGLAADAPPTSRVPPTASRRAG